MNGNVDLILYNLAYESVKIIKVKIINYIELGGFSCFH